MFRPAFRTTVGALAVGQLLTWAALFYGFSSFVLPMQRELGWGRTEVMGAFTLGLGVSGLGAYVVGSAIDRGRGRFVLTSGAVLGGVGFLLWSAAANLPMLYAASVLLGAAMAMTLYDPVFSEVTRRYPRRYREAITALTLVGGFASTLSFPAAAWLIAHLGWRPALVAIGAVLIGVVAPLHAWALSAHASFDVPDRGARGQPPLRLAGATLGFALRGPVFWLLALAFTCHAFVAAAVWAHVVPAFADKGLDETASLAVIVCFGPAQIAGRLVFAAFGSRLDPRQLGILVLALLPASLLLFALADGLVMLVAFAILFGVSNGLTTIVRGTIVPALFGAREVGRISGAIGSVSLFARAAAPLGAAALLVWLHGYRGVGLALTVVAAAAALSFWAARPLAPANAA